MILNSEQRTVIKEGDFSDEKSMTISASAEVQDHIIKLLTENGYKRPIESLVREISCNGIDAHRFVDSEEPVMVRLYRNEQGNWIFEVQDFGSGLTEANFDKYIMGIGESTKRESNKFLGAMGAGAKSPLSYQDSFEMITRKDGTELKFLVYKDARRPKKSKIYEKETDQPNGTTVKIQLKSYYDLESFKKAIRSQLCYFPNIYITVEQDYFNFSTARLFQNELFEWSEIYPTSEMHISLDGVVYPIDWDTLNVDPIRLPVGIKIALDEGVTPMFNREELIYTEDTINLIKAKITKVADWFISKYNSENSNEFNNILDSWDRIGNDFYNITISEKTFGINCLLHHSEIPINKLKLNCVNFKNPEYYKNFRNYLNNYTILSEYEDYKWKTKNIWKNITHRITDGRFKVILVSELPKGNIKQYLLQKYPKSNLLFIKKDYNRQLGTKGGYNEATYRGILNLPNYKKSDWRTFINEFSLIENQFLEKVIDETNCEVPQEWLDKKKELQKLNRSKPDYIAKSLNKQEGDITIGYIRESSRSKPTVEKKAVKISKLQTEPYLFIYSSKDEDKELLSKYYQLTKKLTNIKFALVGKRELTKLPISHKFKNMEQFKNSKPFSRIATSLLINDLLDKYGDIYDNSGVELIKIAVKGMESDIDALREYRKNNPIEKSGSFTEELIQFAKDNNLFDQSIYYICKRVEEKIHDFTFVNLLDKPRSYDTQAKKEYTTFINQVLLWQKLHKDAHKDFKLVEIPKEEVLETTEELED